MRRALKSRARPSSRAGYTLMEVLMAMVVLMIAFVAIIAVQTSALQGYISSRDNMEASEIGRRVADLMAVAGQQWRSGTYSAQAIYDPASGAPFDIADPLTEITSDPWAWQVLYNNPVDVRLGRTSTDAQHVGGKHCVYARGAAMPSALANGPSSVLQVQIAIVYTGPTADPFDCNDQNVIGELNLVGGPGNPPALELRGLRVVYFATTIVRRDYLNG